MCVRARVRVCLYVCLCACVGAGVRAYVPPTTACTHSHVHDASTFSRVPLGSCWLTTPADSRLSGHCPSACVTPRSPRPCPSTPASRVWPTCLTSTETRGHRPDSPPLAPAERDTSSLSSSTTVTRRRRGPVPRTAVAPAAVEWTSRSTLDVRCRQVT